MRDLENVHGSWTVISIFPKLQGSLQAGGGFIGLPAESLSRIRRKFKKMRIRWKLQEILKQGEGGSGSGQPE